MTRKKTSQKPTTPTTTAEIDAFLLLVGYHPDLDPGLDARINILREHPDDEEAQTLLGAHVAAAMGIARDLLPMLEVMYEHWHRRRYH